MTHRKTWLQPVVVLGLCLSAAATRAQYWETTIPVGHLPAHVLWNPTSNRVYVANTESYNVTIIDGATNAVIGTVPVPNNSYLAGLCWNSVENKVYCTSGDPDWLSVIDGAGDTLLRRVRMRGYPTKMAYNSTMNKLYVICYDDQMVRVYDGVADTLVAEVWLGSTPGGTLLYHPTSNRVFCPVVWYSGMDTVVVIDCATDEVAGRRPVQRQPYAMSLNPVNGLVYVKTRYAVYALTPEGDSVVATIGGWANAVCAAPFPNKVYAAGWGPGLGVIDCYTHTVVDSMAVSAGVMVCDTVKGKVYACGVPMPVIDARADTVLVTIPLPGGSKPAIAWNSTNSRVYVAGEGWDVVYVIRDTSTAVAEPVAGTIHANLRVPTVCRGRLRLSDNGPASLLDLTGRQVALLKPGDNDLHSLRSGVYFVRYEDGTYANKVVLQN